jgi:RNA polymerase sigma-54 factor
MAMELKQSQKMSQQLVMTPQLQQAIKLLQLSRIDLIEQIREEMDQNPLLETPDEPGESEAPALEKSVGEASLEAANFEQPADFDARLGEKAQEVKPDEGPNEIDWDNYLNSYQFSEQSLPSNKGGSDLDDMPSFEATMVKKVDLSQLLWEQLRDVQLNDAELRISELIIGNLNDDGYLSLPDVDGDPLIRLCNEADVSMATGEKSLRRIQQLDPKGCGARDLQECLLIQVQSLKEPQAALLGLMLKKHMKALESRNLPLIAKDLKQSLSEVVEASKLLSRLDPRPGRSYSSEEPQYITPDVYVNKVADQYVVVVNDDGLSKLRISDAYRRALKSGEVPSGQTKEFVQEKMRSAVWLLRSIHQRQRTIYKVAESIIKFQRDFFERGVAHLKPLILRDVAEDIGMHESTVSRVTANKYMHTPQGTFELKYFFNSSIARTSGDDMASEAVMSQLKKLISQENPKNPLSDQKLVELLRVQGIDIARRTVAKYREVLGVLPSSKRKKYF